MINNKQKGTIKKIEELSLKYHKLSLLFNQLAESLKLECQQKNGREINKILEGYDFKRLETMQFNEIKDIQKLKGGKEI